MGTAIVGLGALLVGSPPDRAVDSAGAPVAFHLSGQVVKIIDGDTITVRVDGKNHKVRLASIDAPEMHKDDHQRGQPMAQASRRHLAGLLSGKSIALKCYERDRHDREICDVTLADGTTANQQQVAAGMAWANTEKQGRFMRDDQLPALQAQAKREGRGIWQDSNPVAPWVWRYECWKHAQC